jgi:hypothetical protein
MQAFRGWSQVSATAKLVERLAGGAGCEASKEGNVDLMGGREADHESGCSSGRRLPRGPRQLAQILSLRGKLVDLLNCRCDVAPVDRLELSHVVSFPRIGIGVASRGVRSGRN